MFEGIKDLFHTSNQSENIYNLIQQSEHKAAGWYRIVNRNGDFIGYEWACPGTMIRATMPAPKGMATDQAEIPVNQRVGCSFTAGVFTPDEDGIKNIRAKCVHCSSSLTEFLKELGISAKDLPTKSLTTPVQRQRFFDALDYTSDTGVTYEQSDPGAGGLF
jgi:hypothetical protein